MDFLSTALLTSITAKNSGGQLVSGFGIVARSGAIFTEDGLQERPPSTVPEPAGLAVLGLGVLGIGYLRHRRPAPA